MCGARNPAAETFCSNCGQYLPRSHPKPMVYALGIDVGTSYSAAATAREGRVEIFQLGERAATIPSVALHCASCCRFKSAAVNTRSVVLSVSIIVALRLLVESATLGRDWLTKSCPAQLWAWRRYPGAVGLTPSAARKRP